MDNRFLLDREYKTFHSSQQLKFRTVTEMNDFTCGCLVMLAFLYIPVSVLFVGLLLQKVVLEYAYATEGREIEVTVTSCEEHYTKDNEQYPVVTYYYWISGTHYEGGETFDSSTSCDFFYPNSVVNALYLPSNPHESRIIGYEPSLGTRLKDSLLVGFILFIVWGSVVFTLAIIKYTIDKRRFRRLWQHGILRDGEIIAAKSKLVGRASSYYAVITYRFQTPKGHTLTGKQSRHREDLRHTGLPPVGTPIYVLYADDDTHVML
jgi:hypothetical protein